MTPTPARHLKNINIPKIHNRYFIIQIKLAKTSGVSFFNKFFLILTSSPTNQVPTRVDPLVVPPNVFFPDCYFST